MLSYILIESQSDNHHRAFEIEHTGARLEVFNWKGDIESLEKRIRWEYRGRTKKFGKIEIKHTLTQGA